MVQIPGEYAYLPWYIYTAKHRFQRYACVLCLYVDDVDQIKIGLMTRLVSSVVWHEPVSIFSSIRYTAITLIVTF
ncbi:unnamed protein product [Tenebrio molitor]|nr:unnamed protein product [Tenebrio molitor]